MRATPFAVLLVIPLSAGAPNSSESWGVPFELHRDHLVLVKGAIGPSSNLLLLIDTGAARTIVTPTVARSIGLKGTPNELLAFGHRISAEEVALPWVDIGPRRMANASALVTDLVATAAALQLARLDAIVGIDLLRRTSLAIDYSQRELRFGTLVDVPHRAPLARNRMLPVVAAVANGIHVNLVVDSGASHVALFGFAGGVPLGLREDPVRLGGTTTVKPVLLKYLQIGSWRSEQVVALTMARSDAEMTGTDGVLGLPALAASLVQFDFVAHELGWKPRMR